MADPSSAPRAESKHVTDTQIRSIEVAIHLLAKRGNAWGISIEKQIAGKTADEKRRIILGSYGQMYEAMLTIQMAMNSTRTPEQIVVSLAQSAADREQGGH